MKPHKERRVLSKWRMQAVRLVARCYRFDTEIQRRIFEGLLSTNKLWFNVHKVRKCAEYALSEGKRLEQERKVFIDWTQNQGLGPENKNSGAFVLTNAEISVGLASHKFSELTLKQLKQRRIGGWPGQLAREWGTERCPSCKGRGRVESGNGLVRCDLCKRKGFVRMGGYDGRIVNGGLWLIRVSQQLLDTLDGKCIWNPKAQAQLDECKHCKGLKCSLCKNTGHNLEGTIPNLEWSAHYNHRREMHLLRMRRFYWLRHVW